MGDTEGQAAEAEASGENIPEIELIIKASTVDGRRKGACLFCQVNVMNVPADVSSIQKFLIRNTLWIFTCWLS